MNEANYDYASLIEEAEPAIRDILKSLELIKQYYKEIQDALFNALQLSTEIDNTGVH